MLVTAGLSDFNRRLTILGPVVSDAGFYECEATLRSSSVPSVSAGAHLHVHGMVGMSLDSNASFCKVRIWFMRVFVLLIFGPFPIFSIFPQCLCLQSLRFIFEAHYHFILLSSTRC